MHESRTPDSYKSGVVVHICKFQHLGSEGKRIRTSGSPWATFKASLSYMKPCLKTHCLDSYLQTGNIEFHLQFGVKFTVNSGLLKPHCNTCACLNVWEQRHCLHNMWWLTWIISDSGFKISSGFKIPQSVRVLRKRFNWGENIPECGHHHFIGWGPRLNKKETRSCCHVFPTITDYSLKQSK